jgi:hypothetical protein
LWLIFFFFFFFFVVVVVVVFFFFVVVVVVVLFFLFFFLLLVFREGFKVLLEPLLPLMLAWAAVLRSMTTWERKKLEPRGARRESCKTGGVRVRRGWRWRVPRVAAR